MKLFASSVRKLSIRSLSMGLAMGLAPAIAAISIAGGCFSLLAQDRPLRVARVSLIEGEVSSKRADDPNNDWSDAALNLPLSENDQLYSGSNGRAETQLGGQNLIRINQDTNLRFVKLTSDTLQLSLPIGVATFRIHSLDRRQFDLVDARDTKANDPVYFEVDTPTVAVTFVKEGLYRINVLENGATEVIVRNGQAEIYNQEIGTIIVKGGRRAVIEDQGYYQILKLEDKDGWDRWNESRDHELISVVNGSQSARRLPGWIPGLYDLDGHGDWIDTPDYGWVWSPRSAPAGWGPYRSGYWRWNSYYGWTWISYEPWGWIPYHYGRWAYYRNRWCWTPYVNVAFGYDWGWRPHLVTFYGWGGGYSGGYRDGYRDGYRQGRWDYIGWSPLGPRDGHGNRPVNVRTLDNFDAPGGRSIMDRGRFDNGRAVVTQDVVLNAPVPPRPGSRTGATTPTTAIAAPVPVRTDELKPTQAMPTRNPLANRTNVAQRIEAPVVARRPVVRTTGDNRDGQALPPIPARGGTGASTAPGNAPIGRGTTEAVRSGLDVQPTTPVTGQPNSPIRSPRAPEYRPVERIPAPAQRPPVVAQPVPNREYPSRGSQNDSSPSRNERTPQPDMPSRTESPSRNESPRPRVERQDRPQETHRPEAPRPAPQPQRESMPSRAPERPSSPPPQRESAPQRAPERPSSPPPSAPARESAPERPSAPERSTSERPAGPRRP